ncbi:MAG: hypothetical protein LBQ94_09370 [Treponema sp.]|jgi:hypothetical protein|nr:hypothetical protein [Treponema sp.]
MKLRFSVLLLVFFVSFAFADINVPDITDNIISIGEATIVWIDNDISSSGQRDVYSFTAPRDGTYRFEMAELRGAYVRLIAWDSSEQPVADSTISVSNGGGITPYLEGEQTYRIEVRQSGNFIVSPYRLIIGHQKETIDISRLTGLIDGIDYTNQRNVYTFTAPRDGTYRFEMAELRGAYVRLILWDRPDYQPVADTTISVSNGGGITPYLEGGQTYRLEVRQSGNFVKSPYRLIIGHQKETVRINGPDRVNDSIQYTAQRNVYAFTAPADGRYRFEMAELNGAYVRLIAWDRLDYQPIADTTISVSNGGGITFNLTGGQTYRIEVRQSGGNFVKSSYSLVITKQ